MILRNKKRKKKRKKNQKQKNKKIYHFNAECFKNCLIVPWNLFLPLWLKISRFVKRVSSVWPSSTAYLWNIDLKKQKKYKNKKKQKKNLKNQKKTLVKHLCQVASPGGRRLSNKVIKALYNLLNLTDILVIYRIDMNMKTHKIIILSRVSN